MTTGSDLYLFFRGLTPSLRMGLTSFFAGLVLSLAGFPAGFRVGTLHAQRIARFTGILAM
jgi:hypothetical protein